MDAEEKVKILQEEAKVLEYSVSQLHWMARRYADKRNSYVTWMFNDITRKLLKMGVEIDGDREGYFARDLMGREFDGLTDEEASSVKDKGKDDTGRQEAMVRVCTAAINLVRKGLLVNAECFSLSATDDDVQELLGGVHALEEMKGPPKA